MRRRLGYASGMGKDSFSQFRQDAARRLRHAETSAEAKLWGLLRNRRLARWKFRRQHPIGRFIVDFVSPEGLLVIEVDGATHSEPAEIVRDAARTADLEQHGYRVIRVFNSDVYDNPEGVLDLILAALP